mmetsp:Transcript_21512/g.48142  ORF Transcript_21512/g.48142 Transcript_21512/m.48142 type:complete len:229 (-) Transcript_21512:472-1158(-)
MLQVLTGAVVRVEQQCQHGVQQQEGEHASQAQQPYVHAAARLTPPFPLLLATRLRGQRGEQQRHPTVVLPERPKPAHFPRPGATPLGHKRIEEAHHCASRPLLEGLCDQLLVRLMAVNRHKAPQPQQQQHGSQQRRAPHHCVGAFLQARGQENEGVAKDCALNHEGAGVLPRTAEPPGLRPASVASALAEAGGAVCVEGQHGAALGLYEEALSQLRAHGQGLEARAGE